jgi:hypothetical protein
MGAPRAHLSLDKQGRPPALKEPPMEGVGEEEEGYPTRGRALLRLLFTRAQPGPQPGRE